MTLSSQLAKHLREVYFGGNWTCSNLKEHVSGLSWQQATTQVHSFNSIATLVNHTGYYVTAASKVLQGEALNAKDAYSFTHPPIKNQTDWEEFLDDNFKNAEKFAALLDQLPEEKLWDDFTDKKYGLYYRNMHGIVEHLHYHLGQIVLIKKLVLQNQNL